MNNDLITLANRSLVKVSGNDYENFLQSIITIDLSGKDRELLSSCFLSPQGKLLNQFFVTKEDNYFLLDLHKKSFQSFIDKMQIYKLNSDVNFEEKNDLEVVICLDKKFENSLPDPRHKDLGWRGIREKGSSKSNPLNYEKKKISLGIVEEGEDFISGEFFPIELNFDYLNSISFKKGCFIGQEVTSRMHRKGKPKKRVFSITTDRENKPGEDISFENKKIGTIIKSFENNSVAILKTDALPKIKKEKTTVYINDEETSITVHMPNILKDNIV
jgi:hypothetical protein